MDKNPEQPKGFSVVRRNYGHWDIVRSDVGRLFRVRGGPGDYCVLDERPEGIRKPRQEFKTVSACMAYITDLLMFELVLAEGQTPTMIEAWNVCH